MGPISVSLPKPNEPWDSHASRATRPAPIAAMNATVSTVDSKNVNHRMGSRMAIQSSRWFSPSRKNHQPARTPARTGNTTTAEAYSHGSPSGSAANGGKCGNAPNAFSNGEVIVPSPTENPAPLAHAAAHTIMLGR